VLIQAESIALFFGVNNGYSISRKRKETHVTPHKTWLCGPLIRLCNGIMDFIVGVKWPDRETEKSI
jgi:hypothetical protein